MGTPPEPTRDSTDSRAARHGGRRRPRREAASRRSFTSTLSVLDELAATGARVSVHVRDLDRDSVVLAGDDYVTQPIGALGVVPLLIEVAARFDDGSVDPLEIVERGDADAAGASGLWRHLAAPALPLRDVAVLAASAGDARAANLLLERVGLEAVHRRIAEIGLARTAVLDRFRDERGPDDAPHFALGSAKELAEVFAALVNTTLVSAAVSAQVAEWLCLNHDLSLVAAATGLDPFAHDDDDHGLLFINKTGRDRGVRAEAGVLAGPRAGVAYALVVCFDDLSIIHRLRAHEAFRTLGVDLMEYVF